MAASVLLLDLDGTLVDSNAAHAEAFARAAADAGVPLARDRFDREIGKGADHVVPDVFGPAFEAERGDAYRDRTGEHFREIASEQTFRVFEGAARLAQAARERGLRTALATSSSEDDLDALFESAGHDFRDDVDYVTTSSDVEDSKPDPDLVSVVAGHFGVPPAACVLVGDTVYDGRAARRGGAAFVGVATWTWDEAALSGVGARATYASTAALADDLDAALGAAAPGEAALATRAVDALFGAAVAEARRAVEAGDAPIGAVVGRADGTVVARGRNRSSTGGDPLLHAETQALHALAETSEDRDGLVLVTTLEPCAMCLGAATEAGLHAVLFGVEAPPNGAAGCIESLPGRTVPLCAQAGDRDLALSLLREGADHAFVARLLRSLDA